MKKSIQSSWEEIDKGFDRGAIIPVVMHDSYSDESELHQESAGKHMRDVCLSLFLWGKVRTGEPIQFLVKLVRLFEKHPKSYVYLIDLIADNFSDWSKSYSERGNAVGTSKQNIQQLDVIHAERISELFPELGDFLRNRGGIDTGH